MFALILLLSLSSMISNAYPANGSNWIRQNTPVNSLLSKCSFVDSLTGWAAGEEGVIIHTTNGGTVWSIQQTNIILNIYDISFVNERLGWAVANGNFSSGTEVLSTTNGGLNWTNYRYPDSTFLLYSIHFRDSLNGFMGGYGGVLLKTSNGGINWSFCNRDTNNYTFYPVLKINFHNEHIGIATGGLIDLAGVVWITTDGGNNWTSKLVSNEPVYDIHFFNSSDYFGAGGDYKFGTLVSRSNDSGSTWSFESLNMFGVPKAIAFRNSTEGWMPLSFANRFAYSTDAGDSWNTVPVPGNNSMYDICFPDEAHGYSVGSNGSVYKYVEKSTSINHFENSLPLRSKLHGNFPNPFNPATTIKFDVVNESGKFIQPVKIQVFDILGREKQVLLNENLRSGTYSITFDGSGYQSGVYFLRMNAGNYEESVKIVLLK